MRAQPDKVVPTERVIKKRSSGPRDPTTLGVLAGLRARHRHRYYSLSVNPLVGFALPGNWRVDGHEERADTQTPNPAENVFRCRPILIDVQLEEVFIGGSRGNDLLCREGGRDRNLVDC